MMETILEKLFGQNLQVKAILEQHPASKIVFRYEVINLATGEMAAVGSTTQVFLGIENKLLELVKPHFFAEWEAKQDWQGEE